MEYAVEQFGDISGKDKFGSLEEALRFIEKNIGTTTDPEDNRITVTEVLESGHGKVVWHFSGWHWNADEYGIPQGKLLGHEKSMYAESNDF